jgi:hypothetical protein
VRDDSGVFLPIAFAVVPILFGAADALDAYVGARHDPTWETRWLSLDPAERAWLAVVATSRSWMATLTDPEEMRLAKGRRSRERRERLVFDLVALLLALAAAAVALAGLTPSSIAFWSVFGLFLVLRPAWLYRRERQIKGTLETQRRLAAAT